MYYCISDGPHLDDEGKIDPRIWFNVPVKLDADAGTITYIIFPYGAEDEEFQIVDVEATGSWISEHI